MDYKGSWLIQDLSPPQIHDPRGDLAFIAGRVHTLSFNRRFSAIETGADEINILEYHREQFLADLPRYQCLLGDGVSS